MAAIHPKAGGRSLCEGAPGPRTPTPLASLVGHASGRAPAGIALRLGHAPEGEANRYELVLVDRSGATLLALGSFPDDEAVAAWRELGADSGLELMIENADGALERPYPQIGRVLLGPVRIRRRHGFLNGRRPRFLSRRKTGEMPLRPAVHDEAEMFGRGR